MAAAMDVPDPNEVPHDAKRIVQGTNSGSGHVLPFNRDFRNSETHLDSKKQNLDIKRPTPHSLTTEKRVYGLLAKQLETALGVCNTRYCEEVNYAVEQFAQGFSGPGLVLRNARSRYVSRSDRYVRAVMQSLGKLFNFANVCGAVRIHEERIVAPGRQHPRTHRPTLALVSYMLQQANLRKTLLPRRNDPRSAISGTVIYDQHFHLSVGMLRKVGQSSLKRNANPLFFVKCWNDNRVTVFQTNSVC